MPFRFRANESVIENVRRMACEQIDAALAEVADPELPSDVVVHQVRKRTKKIRGLLRLVKAGFPDRASEENATLRGAAERLSTTRDFDVALETLQSLKPKLRKRLSKDAVERIRQAVIHQRDALASGQGRGANLPERLQEFAAVIQATRDRASGWRMKAAEVADEEDELVIAGAAETYRKAHKQMKLARALGDSEAASCMDQAVVFHDWRKRVKDHGYHLRMLRDVVPDWSKQQGEVADELGELLGNDHDLFVLEEIIKAAPSEMLSAAEIDDACRVLCKRSSQLRSQALQLGEELFAERPKDFRRRLANAWEKWHTGKRRKQ